MTVKGPSGVGSLLTGLSAEGDSPVDLVQNNSSLVSTPKMKKQASKENCKEEIDELLSKNRRHS